MNAAELLTGVGALSGARASGQDGNGITSSRLLNGIEYAHASDAPEAKLRAAWRQRQGGGAAPLVLVADDPDASGLVLVLGPQNDGPLRRIRADAMLGVVKRTLPLKRIHAIRLVAEEVERLDAERVAGLKVRGLGTEHLYGERLPGQARWSRLRELSDGVNRAGWRELLGDLGYALSPLPRKGYLCTAGDRPAVVVHPHDSATRFARLDEHGHLPEGALVADCRAHGARYGILAAGPRLRLLAAGDEDVGTATRYLELDASTLEPDRRPLLGLLAPEYLADGGLGDLLGEARDYGQKIRRRLDVVLRQDVLPRLGLGLGRWARDHGFDPSDDRVREELEAAVLIFVFRTLFLLYAESAGHLPMANATYSAKSLTRTAERAWLERDELDERAASLWDDVQSLVRKMRTGQRAWDLPAYNGDLFAAGDVLGASILERATLTDAELAPALVAVARDAEDPSVGVDFSGLEIGHLGYIYEGLLSLRLSPADRDYVYDARSDRYVATAVGQEPEVQTGELLWLTNEGGRKGGGVYYTRTELVRHLVRGAVGPAFASHLDEIRALARENAADAAARLFDFYVLDPACGSGHFLVEVVDELADKIAALLGDIALPAVAAQLEALRSSAGATWGAGIEDTALLKRLVLKRCVYGVDLSPMGAEIAKVSLWLHAFVPGLSLAYLDHNIQCGNSLIGVARADVVAPGGPDGQVAMFGEGIADAVAIAAEKAAVIRQIDDSTPGDFASSRTVDEELHKVVRGTHTVFDLWTADSLGLAGSRDEALLHGDALLLGHVSPTAQHAIDLSRRERFLHWPLAFAEVFAGERPGFDAVVGNPPWEEVNIDELNFFALRGPTLRGAPHEDRARVLARLKAERPELVTEFVAQRAAWAEIRSYFGPDTGYSSSSGNADLYKYFCQRYRVLVRSHGALGVVLPRGAFNGKGSTAFREWLLSEAPPRRIDFLVNKRRWAFDIHAQTAVGLLISEVRAPTENERIDVAGVAESAAAFKSQVSSAGISLDRAALGLRLEVPLLVDQRVANLLAKLRRGGPFPRGGGAWRCFPVQGDFNETTDRALWEGASEGLALWKGDSFTQYAPHGRDAGRCPESAAALRRASKSRPGAESVHATETSRAQRLAAVARTFPRARVAFHDVANRLNARTAIACLVPPKHFLLNSAPYLCFLDEDLAAEATCLGVMNSLVFDWQVRRFAEHHLNFFTLENLRVPDLDERDAARISRIAARLSCVDTRFADFARGTGVVLGPTTPDDHDALRAEIDAVVARAYGLNREELELVFADFRLDAVTSRYRELVRERFAAL